MKRHPIILSTLLLVLALGVLTPQFAQDTPANPPGPNLERRAHILGLLRTINTSEVTYQSKYGSFGTWQALLSDQPKYFEKFLSMNGLLQANVRFGEAPEILPGLNLRMNVHTDGQGYDVLLEDTTDKEHGYGALSDERGMIRESKWLQ
jgi:hypothetical protein